MKRIKFFASILLMLCFSVVCCAQTKIDWKQIKNIPDTLEFKNVLLEHLLFKSAYQPVMESIHQGAIYYDNMLERLRVYEHGQWRDLSVTIASDSIGAPLTILGYLQASDIYASQSAYIGKDVNVKGNVNASGTSTFNYLKVNNALKVPTVASATLGVGSVYYDTSANKLKVLNSSNQWKVVSVDVDSALSTTSTNPVENKAITAKINQTDADLINGMATTLQQSYNYANGIATQAYNYADSAATDAETASKNYADLQVRLLNSTISEKLASGTSDLNVNSVKARNASFTDNLQLPFFTGQLGNGLLAYDSSQKHLVLTYREDVNQYASKAIADKHYVDRNYVSDVATSTVNGTITVTKNGVSTNVAVKGLGSAAFANVASFTGSSIDIQPIQLTANYYESVAITYPSNGYACQGANTTVTAFLFNVSNDTTFLYIPAIQFNIQNYEALKISYRIDGDLVYGYSLDSPNNTNYVSSSDFTGVRPISAFDWHDDHRDYSNSPEPSTQIILPDNIFGEFTFGDFITPNRYTRRSARNQTNNNVVVTFDVMAVCSKIRASGLFGGTRSITVKHYYKNSNAYDYNIRMRNLPMLIMFKK